MTIEINVREWLEIAGFGLEHESSAAITLGAHFEHAIHETSLEEAREQLGRVEKWGKWWVDQREILEIKYIFSYPAQQVELQHFVDGQERRYRMIHWFACTTLALVEAGDFVFPEHLHMDRKTTGAYYTPKSLIDELIKSALDPVIAAALGH